MRPLPRDADPRAIVTAGYDDCGPRYSAARASEPAPEVELLLAQLPPGARVLDVGCGGGSPVTAALVERGDLVGVDISPVQIAAARRRFPEASFRVGDIMAQSFEPASFDAVVAFYALFHLPREEHQPLLERIAGWLRPGGHLLATLAGSDHPGYTERGFFGVTMYWSHFEAAWYTPVLEELGFEILESGVLGHGYGDSRGRPRERHPIVFARKGAG